MAGPLAGVRVVEVAGVVSVPWATMLLADQGAQVVKIEPPVKGDILRHAPFGCGGMSAFFANCNRGKRSVVLDLTHPDGRAAALDLVAGADVFVENHRPGVLGRLGLGEADLRAVRPDLIHVSVTGYGPDGPYSDGRIYDPIIRDHGVAAGPVLSLDEVFEDPQVVHNQAVRTRTHPAAGPMREARPAARFSVTAAPEMPLAPLLGEHTTEVLAEIGYDAARIDALRAAGACG